MSHDPSRHNNNVSSAPIHLNHHHHHLTHPLYSSNPSQTTPPTLLPNLTSTPTQLNQTSIYCNFPSSNINSVPLRRSTSHSPFTPELGSTDIPGFIANINRQVSRKLLKGKEAGSYLIRPSSKVGRYAISYVKDSGDIEHQLVIGSHPPFMLMPPEDPLKGEEDDYSKFDNECGEKYVGGKGEVRGNSTRAQDPQRKLKKFDSFTDLVASCPHLKKSISVPNQPLVRRLHVECFDEEVERIAHLLETNTHAAFTSFSWRFLMSQNQPASRPLRHDTTKAGAAAHNDTSNGRRTQLNYLDTDSFFPEWHSLHGKFLTKLCNSLKKNSTLNSLTIAGIQWNVGQRIRSPLKDSDAVELALALTEHRGQLKELDLHQNDIGDAGAEALSEFIGSSKSLTLLDLTCNRIKEDGLISLAKGIRDHCGPITVRIGAQMAEECKNMPVLYTSPAHKRLLVLIEDMQDRKNELSQLTHKEDATQTHTSTTNRATSTSKQVHAASPLWGFLSREQAQDTLLSSNNLRPGSYLFYLNPNIPHAIVVAFVIEVKEGDCGSSQNHQTQHAGSSSTSLFDSLSRSTQTNMNTRGGWTDFQPSGAVHSLFTSGAGSGSTSKSSALWKAAREAASRWPAQKYVVVHKTIQASHIGYLLGRKLSSKYGEFYPNEFSPPLGQEIYTHHSGQPPDSPPPCSLANLCSTDALDDDDFQALLAQLSANSERERSEKFIPVPSLTETCLWKMYGNMSLLPEEDPEKEKLREIWHELLERSDLGTPAELISKLYCLWGFGHPHSLGSLCRSADNHPNNNNHNLDPSHESCTAYATLRSLVRNHQEFLVFPVFPVDGETRREASPPMFGRT